MGNIINAKLAIIAGVAVSAIVAGAAIAQPPAAPPAAPAAPAADAPRALVSTAPTYVSIKMEIAVNKPAAEVWARVGKYCDISEWLRIAAGCTIRSGPTPPDFGTLRSVGNEVLVGMTPLSYTYAQMPNPNARTPYNGYHGTLEARAVTATTSKLVYTLMYDNSMVTGDKAAEMANRRRTFEGALANMKILAEGGTLPAAPARAGGAAPARPGGAPAPAAAAPKL